MAQTGVSPLRKGNPKAKADYDRGWNASKRYASSEGSGPSPLERADSRGESKNWYLGYEDHASDYPKYRRLEE
jgi:hypothetical protein